MRWTEIDEIDGDTVDLVRQCLPRRRGGARCAAPV